MSLFENILKEITLEKLNVLFILGIILFGGTIGGRLFNKIKIPQVVGYILIGIGLGQTGLHFVSKELLLTLEPINYIALGLISFSLGGEIKLGILKKYGKIFTSLLFFEAFGAFLLVSLFIFILCIFFMPVVQSVIVALLLGSISAATAAAGTTDVLAENRAKGLLTTTLMGIIALDDVLALLLFAILSSFSSIISGLHSDLLSNIIKPIYEIGVAALLGIGTGFVLSKILKKYDEEERIFLFTTGSIILVIGLSLIIHVDMLMAATIMGFTLSNFAPKRNKTVLTLIEKFSGPIYILFFVFVGAKIELNHLSILVLIIIGGFIIFRVFGKAIGIYIGSKISKAPDKLRKYLPFCLFSQSGVAIGLSILAYQKFPGEIGSMVLTVIATTTFVVQLIGPIFLKIAITKAGEKGLNLTETDILKVTKVKELLKYNTDNIVLMYQDYNLNNILEIFSKSDYFNFPVVNKSKEILGIINFDNIKNTLNLHDLNDFLLAVDIMSDIKQTINDEISLYEVKEIFKKYSIDAVPVLNTNNKVIGIVDNDHIDHFIKKQLFYNQKKSET